MILNIRSKPSFYSKLVYSIFSFKFYGFFDYLMFRAFLTIQCQKSTFQCEFIEVTSNL